MSTACVICDNNLNSTIRKSVCCPYCEFTACRKCCETYILDGTTSKCMNPPCNREWTRQFIAKSFSDVFLSKKLKKKREEILFDIERSLMPATQPIVERLLRPQKIDNEIQQVCDKIAMLDFQNCSINYSPIVNFVSNIPKHRPEYWAQLRIWQQQLETVRTNCNNIEIKKYNKRELKEKIGQLRYRLSELQNEREALYQESLNRNPYGRPQPEQPQRQRAEFIRACPDNDCRGFLSTQWKCGLCEKWSCPQCHEIKGLNRDVEHVCNPETVASVRLLSNDTKPCPSCRAGIFRISGCNHMWCTKCNTGFNWITGAIERAGLNPHYYEWARRNGNDVPRNEGDNPCQQNLLNYTLFTRTRNLLLYKHHAHPLSNSCSDLIMRLVQNAIHMEGVIMPRYAIRNREDRNQNLRIDYMMNKLSEENFKLILQRNEKKHEKYREIHNIFDLLKTTITDIIIRFIDHLDKSQAGKWDDKILNEIGSIINYANECFSDISKTYKSKCIVITNELEISR